MAKTRVIFFFFQAEDGIRDLTVTGVQTCALPILMSAMVTSGVASFSTKRDSRGSHAIGVPAPCSATSSRPNFEIGANGLSFTSLPARIGISSSSSVTSWRRMRSEEHTSELQSQSNLVCRLLLEKKKKRK